MVNTRRLDAYNLSADTIENYFQTIKTENPIFILGYTSSLFKLAKYIEDNKFFNEINHKLQCVISTSEAILPTEANMMQKSFKVPIVSEYGMAETGMIAPSFHGYDNMKVFWDRILMQADEKNNIYITTLAPKAFPLIRYRTDDSFEELINEHSTSILTFRQVKGRSRESIIIKTINGEQLELSGILIVHLLKTIPGVYAVYVSPQGTDKQVKIILEISINTSIDEIIKIFISDILVEHPNIDTKTITFESTNRIKKLSLEKNNFSLTIFYIKAGRFFLLKELDITLSPILAKADIFYLRTNKYVNF